MIKYKLLFQIINILYKLYSSVKFKQNNNISYSSNQRCSIVSKYSAVLPIVRKTGNVVLKDTSIYFFQLCNVNQFLIALIYNKHFYLPTNKTVKAELRIDIISSSYTRILKSNIKNRYISAERITNIFFKVTRKSGQKLAL